VSVSFRQTACHTRSTHSKEAPHVNVKNKKEIIDQLNRILECELAGVVRYTHYSMMIFGYNRIPIVSWFQAEATESLTHAQQAGEHVTRLGGHPSLAIGPLLETHEHDIGQILRETLQAEHTALGLYNGLLKLVAGKSVALEEYARDLIEQEEAHIDEIDKMLRKPGDVQISKEARDLG
jgi:bacterioferritin